MSAAGISHAELAILRNRFARKGYELQRVFLVGNPCPSYHVTRNTQTRIFSHPNDLAAFLAVAESLPV